MTTEFKKHQLEAGGSGTKLRARDYFKSVILNQGATAPWGVERSFEGCQEVWGDK